MIDLVVLACLISQPDHCRQHIITAEGSTRACMQSSIMTLARWAGDHPGWHIETFRCEEFGQDA
ncbi:hypothetical protein [Rhizobium sp. EC-SD404]|uniref:hypothetical protein n=1 Tax=Rhizobium sp. EC-SD404 TaxID=2038389 RepID=UPI0012586443|nr:hypothetical protein [Rhizobium sp. EC-SD404]VVT19663.1 conserved hypothetical protein [Rhizobium sp. EC-SD404]